MKKILIALFIFAIAGCKKDQIDPEPPEISFGGWNYVAIDKDGHDSIVELNINFKDRNGDIGRIESELFDKCGTPIYDLFIYYEKKINNVYTPEFVDPAQPDSALDENCNIVPGSYVANRQINFTRALEYLQPEGNNRSIEGEIIYKLDYDNALSILNKFPAGRCKVFLLDRARNKSNEIYTEDLIVH